ncbi:MAG: lysylphosphatidylglycerol synthase transmembrane domain-containing protein [Sphingomonadales bacterium]
MSARPALPRRGLKLALGLLISAVFLYATFATVPLRKVAGALEEADPFWLFAALLFIALAYTLKVYRWLTMLRSLGATIGLGEAAVPFLGGVAFNNVLPLRAGDIIRVVAFQRFTGIAPSGQLGTLALERLMDLLVLTSILFATVSLWQVRALDGTLLEGLRLVAAAAVAAVLIFILAPRPTRLVVRWAEARIPRLRPIGDAVLRLSDAVATLSRPLFLVRIALLSILAWLAEGGAYFAVGMALGVGAHPQIALLALSVGTLATMIPSSPGYVGTFHYFAARVVAAFGAGPVAAAAYAVLIHALLWLSTTGTGFLALAISGMRGRPAVAAAAIGNGKVESK